MSLVIDDRRAFVIDLFMAFLNVEKDGAFKTVEMPAVARLSWVVGYGVGADRYQRHGEVYDIEADPVIPDLIKAVQASGVKDTPELRNLAELLGRWRGGMDGVQMGPPGLLDALTDDDVPGAQPLAGADASGRPN